MKEIWDKVKRGSKWLGKKTSFIFQFIVTLIFICLLYFFITTHEYQGYWSRDLLIGMGITGLFSLVVLIYHIKQYYQQVEKMFLTFAIPIGILFLVFMLPEYIPDGAAHTWRAYEISQGNFLGREDSQVEIPIDLQENRENIANYYQYNQLLQKTTDYDDTVLAPSPAKSYSFLLYLPAAVGMAIGRMCHLNVFVATYIARAFNLLVFLGIGYWAIKKIPFGKKVLGVYMLMPMVVQQAVSFSADSLMNTSIFLYIAYTVYLLLKEKLITKKEKIFYMILMIFIGIAKVTYIPIIALAFPLFFKKNMKTKQEKIIFLLLSIIICLASYASLAWINQGNVNDSATDYLTDNYVNSREQLQYLLQNPLRIIEVLWNNQIENGEAYFNQMIGNDFGWLSIQTPSLYVLYMMIILVMAIFTEKNEVVLSRAEKVWTVLLALGMYVLINIGLYLEWTGVAEPIIAGVQGRYFIPIAVLVPLCCCMENNFVKLKYANVLLWGATLGVHILTIIEIVNFFL